MGSTHGEAAGVPPAGPPLRFAFLRRGGLGWAVTCPDLCPRLSVSIGNHLQGRCFGEAEQDGPCMRTGALVCPPCAPRGWLVLGHGHRAEHQQLQGHHQGDALWGGATTQELPSCQASHTRAPRECCGALDGAGQGRTPPAAAPAGEGERAGHWFLLRTLHFGAISSQSDPCSSCGNHWLMRFLTDSCFLIF